MEQAKNAATNETAASFAFEVLSITPQHMDEDYYVIPANITFKSQQDSPTVREYATLFFSEMYPSMHAMHKGPMGKAIFEMSVKSMAEALNKQAVARGQKPEDMVAASFYTISDAVLSVERKNLEKQAQKQQKKAKGNKANKEDEKAVVYDINEEWDF